MNAIVFAGPSISREAVEALDNVEWRPPVSQGDVYRAAKSSPSAIAIVDGYFEGVPSVWHKEILWAMSRGVHVMGASSMGALRAAELHQFGMHGVGEIYENYRDGIFEDDDEVAVLHGPAELGFLPLSLPMVNVRATIESAQEASVFGKKVADELVALAKSIFYQQRQWQAILIAAKRRGVAPKVLSSFERWLVGGERDIKRQDAEALLAELRAFLAQDSMPMRHDYSFEWTVMWDEFVMGKTGVPAAQGDAGKIDIDQLILDELRLDPNKYRRVNVSVRLKQMALHEAAHKRIDVDDKQTRKQLQQLRESLGLYSRRQLDSWIKENDWGSDKLQQALEDEQRYKIIVDGLGEIDENILLDQLRLSGEYAPLKALAEAKRATDISSLSTRDINPAQLLAWYFESQLGESIPADLDGYLVEIGIYTRKEFYRLIKKHYRSTLALHGERR